MPIPNAVDRWFFAIDAADVPSHVAVMATYAIPDGAPDDFVRRLADDMRASRTFAAPFNYRLKRTALRRVAPELEILPNEDIDVDYHFRHSALPQPAGERELGVLVSRLFSRPLDPHKPLWEVHLIEGLDDSTRFAWFFKVHHGLMDGMGGMRRFTEMMSRDADSDELRPIWTLTSRSRPRSPDDGWTPAQVPGQVVGLARSAVTSATALASSAAGLAVERVRSTDDALAVPYGAPMSVLNGRVGQQRRFATQSYDMDRIVAVAKGFDVTVNDVFLALCAGGLRAYLIELGELPDSSLTVGIPVSVRDPGDEESSNAISAVLTSLRTDIDDPVARIRAISASSGVAKRNLLKLPAPARNLFGAVILSPLAVTQFSGLAGRTPPPFNLLVSSVPGPKEPLYLRRARLEGLYPLSIVSHGQALNISADSMSGRFNIGILGCRDTLPSLQRLAVHTGEALEELEAALAAEQERPAKQNRRQKQPS